MKNRVVSKGFTTREQNIAVRLSGKVKNFTGRGPGVIKVKINDSLATVQLKWFLTAIEKRFLETCNDQKVVYEMRNELIEHATGNLYRAFTEVFNSDVRIMKVDEHLIQEKLSIQVEIMEQVS